MWRRFLLPALLVAAAACSTRAPHPPAAPAPPAASSRIDDESFRPSKAVRWVRDSAEQRALCIQVYRAATAHVETAAAT